MSPRRARLRPGLAMVEQVYRGEQSFIVKDRAASKYFRFRPVEALVMRTFDGTRTAAEIAATLAADGLKVSAAAVEGFADKLASLGLIERSLAERTTLEVERLRAERRRRRQSWFRGDLFRMRWSIGDPDHLLSRLLPGLRWCFSPIFLACSVLLFAVYFVILSLTWTDFSRTVDALYSPSTLTLGAIAVLLVTGFIVIAVHELGHAFTCKYFGGEVHEMGFMMLYFMPAFYCNVNDAWSFPGLRARLWVTAAGCWIQLVLAALAAIVWWMTMPGTLASEVAVAAMLVGGATTILTNLNPLIPLDGYFALSDYLAIPNLRLRALGYVTWWVKRHVLRLELPEPPVTERERRVFLLYGVLAVAYIGGLFLFIAGLLLGWAQRVLGAVGGVLAVVALLVLARRPLREWRRAVVLSLRSHRAALARSTGPRRLAAALLLVALLSVLVPWPLRTSGAFTSAPALTLSLLASDSGVVTQVLAREGARVEAGTPLVRLRDFSLEREQRLRERTADSLAAREARARALGMAAVAERLAAERAAATAQIAALRSRLDALTLRARVSGVVTTRRPEELLGQWRESGDTVVTLSDLDSIEVRIALSGGGAAFVRPGQSVSLVSYADVGQPIRAAIASVSPMTGSVTGHGGVEARVRLPTAGAWRPGVSGEASVEFGRSTVLGALWWAVRTRVRTDLLL